jgi:hypothetical protein
MVTYNNLGMPKPVVGGSLNTWGAELNTASDLVSDAMTGIIDHSVAAGGIIVLTDTDGISDEERQAHYRFTGTMASNTTVLWPNNKTRMFSVHNDTNVNARTLSCGADDGVGGIAGVVVEITRGDTVILGSTGTDVFERQTAGGSPTGAAGGDLTGTYPNPDVTSTSLAVPLPLVQGGTNNATGLPSGAITSGSLNGSTYPNPSLAGLHAGFVDIANPTITVSTTGLVTAATAGATPPIAATEADMEAASATTLYASPGTMIYSPSTAKAWAFLTFAGATPTAPTISASRNISTVSHPSEGNWQLNFTNSMSSANFAAVATVKDTGGNARIAVVTGQSASSVSIRTLSVSDVSRDFETLHVVVFGELT